MPSLPLQDRRNRIHHTTLQPPVLNPQHLPRPPVIKPIHIRREIILNPLRRQSPRQLRVPVSDNIREPLVGEVTCHNVESLPASVRPHDGPDVREGHVADVDPREDGRGGVETVAHPAEDQVADALVRGVDGVQGRELPLDRAEGVCVADRGEVEVWLLVCDESPGGLLGQFLCGDG